MYAVMTWGAKMPATFPIDTPQNSGNMVHAQAPFKMFPNAVGIEYGWKQEGYSSFAHFANEKCEAVIIPFANTIRTDPKHDARGEALSKSLDSFKIPVIPFGVGAQAPSTNLDEASLGPGMQAFVRKLVEVSPAVSVRGDFTYGLFKRYATVDNIHVTGCPSFFSRPESFVELRAFLSTNPDYRDIAFAGSLHHLPTHKRQLYAAIEQNAYIIEPVNPRLHKYYLNSLRTETPAEAPYFLTKLVREPRWSESQLQDFIAKRYRLFRDLDTWLAFNRESIDGTVGSRFHVNMASLLSGRPATWFVHDSRTIELCEKLALPHVTMEAALERPYRDILKSTDFEPMFNALEENFEHFNDFLRAADLPQILKPPLDAA